ncbi:MAG: hypothetical protein P9L88_06660 [Candidatus Tantalella remota]|nr:hypothetical protein [Candidatus Tantalella remota]
MKIKHNFWHTLNKIYGILIRVYFDLVRDPIVILARSGKKNKRPLILDMDWYKWSLNDQEKCRNLCEHPLISKHADFIRVERAQIFNGRVPDLDVTGDNYKEVSYGGFNLWGICRATIISKLATFKIESSQIEEVRIIFEEAAKGIDNLKTLFEKLRPDTVFIFQGGFYDSRCVVEVARRIGINVVGVENSMMSGLVFLDNLSGQIINRHSLARTGRELLETWNVTDRDREDVCALWRSKLTDKSEEHRTGGVDDPEEIRKAFGIPSGKKILLLLAQVCTDASIVLDSTLYEDPIDMIEEVSREMQGTEDAVLVIRLHPKELKGVSPTGTPYDRLTYRLLKERGVEALPGVYVVEDPQFNTYSLMEMADAGITINSQAGFEMCLMGKPVMVCGNAFYGGKGFTVDLGNPAALGPMLEFLLNEAVMTPKEQEVAFSFLHLLYKRQLFDNKLSINQERLLQIFLAKPVFDKDRYDFFSVKQK